MMRFTSPCAPQSKLGFCRGVDWLSWRTVIYTLYSAAAEGQGQGGYLCQDSRQKCCNIFYVPFQLETWNYFTIVGVQ